MTLEVNKCWLGRQRRRGAHRARLLRRTSPASASTAPATSTSPTRTAPPFGRSTTRRASSRRWPRHSARSDGLDRRTPRATSSSPSGPGTANGSIREVDDTTHGDQPRSPARPPAAPRRRAAGTPADQAVVDPESLTIGAGGSLYYGTAAPGVPLRPARAAPRRSAPSRASPAPARSPPRRGRATAARPRRRRSASEAQQRRRRPTARATCTSSVASRCKRIDAGTGILHTVYVARSLPRVRLDHTLRRDVRHRRWWGPTSISSSTGTFDVGAASTRHRGDVYRAPRPRHGTREPHATLSPSRGAVPRR